MVSCTITLFKLQVIKSIVAYINSKFLLFIGKFLLSGHAVYTLFMGDHHQCSWLVGNTCLHLHPHAQTIICLIFTKFIPITLPMK